jgi:hypothetical protein
VFAQRFMLAVALGTLLLVWPTSASGQTAPSLTLVSPAALSISPGTSSQTVTIRNESAQTVELEFATVPAASGVTVSPTTATSLPGLAVMQVKLRVVSKAKYQGTLVASAAGVAPATIPLTIQPSPAWPAPTIVVSLVFGFLFVLLRWIVAYKSSEATRWRWALGTRMGGIDWDFSKSFGSVIGLFGAVLGLGLEIGPRRGAVVSCRVAPRGVRTAGEMSGAGRRPRSTGE